MKRIPILNGRSQNLNGIRWQILNGKKLDYFRCSNSLGGAVIDQIPYKFHVPSY